MPTSKLGIEVLKTLQKSGYVGEFEHIDDRRGGKFKIKLLAKITKCGAITPRFKVKKTEYNEWEQQYLPSYSRGMLLVTTNQGVMSHYDAANKGLGGLLIGYVY
jgi:small subunit ribosomal protein S8